MTPHPIEMPLQYESKSAWRAWAKAQRSAICSSTVQQQAVLQQALVLQLAQWLRQQYTRPARIGIYFPLPLEPNVLALIAQFPQHQWCFPRMGNAVLGENSTGLVFHQLPATLAVQPVSVWQPLFTTQSFGVKEPPVDWQKAQQPHTLLDSLLIPCLALDAQTGVRLGYGGGYYDRFLAGCMPQHCLVTVGICWHACLVSTPATLPQHWNDIALQYCATEQDIMPTEFKK
jgi:5-formyltetrahydrofolate cyclo-ligase